MMNTIQKNPFIGPRTFQRDEGHLFFGREREASDLIALVTTRQLVLFYAQSGAGKSSIVNTRLIPGLEKKNYEVLPVSRVSGDVPTGDDVDNVFVYNLIRGLVQHKEDPEILAKLSLAQFLARLNVDADGYFYDPSPLEETAEVPDQESAPVRRALIIDQFEELLSTHPEAWEKREDFFVQLAQAMQEDPYLWVVLVMREDYIAMLDPYAHLVSGGLRVRYYMERLGWEAALTAVKSPVAALRPFAPGVAEKLVENLASIKVRKPDGTLDIQPGQYVEPVQMQVVCYSLWENLSSKGSQITEADLREVGDVSESLERYYNQRVSAVANAKSVPERLIREWFEKELITSSGTRNMVLRDQDNSAGLGDDVIQTLQGDLVRAETRAGQMWYELSHDRLIEPVRKSNSVWFEKNLSIFQRQAELWNQQGRSEGLLLRGNELEKAEEEAGQMELTSVERVYLDSSRALRKREERDIRQRRAIIAALIVSVVLLVVAGFSYASAVRASTDANAARVVAEAASKRAEQAQADSEASAADAIKQKELADEEKRKAEDQRNIALAGNLAAQADSKKSSDHTLALLLGMEALEREPNLLTRTTMLELLQFSPYRRLSGVFIGSVTSVAVGPDGIFAAASCAGYDNNRQCTTGGITLLNANMDQSREVSDLNTTYGYVYGLAFYEYDDMLVLAAAGCISGDIGCTADRGQITLWKINGLNEPERLASFGSEHTARVKTIAFNSDGTLLASGSYDKSIILWDLSNINNPKMYGQKLEGHSSFVNGVAFSPLLEDTNILISVGDDRTILRWDVSGANNEPKPKLISTKVTDPDSHTAPVNSVAFSPDGKIFASASDDTKVILWDSATSQRLRTLSGHTGYVKSIDFNSDGTELASTGFDNKIILWDVATGDQIGLPLTLHTRAINDVAFGSVTMGGSDQLFLLSASDDRTVIRWDLTTRKPVSYTVSESTFSGDGGLSVSNGILTATVLEEQSQNIELLNTDTRVATTLSSHTGPINFLTFSPNGSLLASASDDQTVILWDMSDVPEDQREFLKLDGFENPISKVYFSEDGKQLVVIEKNGENTTRWLIDPSDWLDRACTAVNDKILTKVQWDNFSQSLQGQLPRETCVIEP